MVLRFPRLFGKGPPLGLPYLRDGVSAFRISYSKPPFNMLSLTHYCISNSVPFPSREDVLNFSRMREHPEDFAMQDPAHQFESVEVDGVAMVRFASTNPEAYRLKRNSFAVWGWCMGGRDHGPRASPCERPHPVNVVLIRGIRDWKYDEGRSYGLIANVYQYREEGPYFQGPDDHCEDKYDTRPVCRYSVPISQLLWVRALRNPLVDWSPGRHRQYGKVIRAAVRCVMNIWRLEPGCGLHALPRELLWIIFSLL